MNKKRSKQTGKFTRNQVRDPVASATEYYQKHKRELDKIIPDIHGVSKEKQFVDRFKYGIAGRGITNRSNTKKQFLEKVKYVKAHLQGYNLDALEAKEKGINADKYGFKDKRKLNWRKFNLKQDMKSHYYTKGNDEIEGYFEINNSDVVIAKVYSRKYSNESPEARFEFFKKNEIGL